MAIDPALITTVRVGELPINPITLTSKLAHEVGDILSQATVQGLVTFLQAQTTAQQYEIKVLRPPGDGSAYINANFDMSIGSTQGIGKTDGLWAGWAICNGNNGTDNMDGQTFIGYGANYNIVGDFLGTEEETLSVSQIPPHYHHTPGSDFKGFVSGSGDLGGNTSSGSGYDSGGNSELAIGNLGTNYNALGAALEKTIGGGQAHNNIQPSGVFLMIMKL